MAYFSKKILFRLEQVYNKCDIAMVVLLKSKLKGNQHMPVFLNKYSSS